MLSKLSAIALAALLATSSSVFAQSSDPAWLEDMNLQIMLSEECEVSYIVSMREGKLGAKNTYEARVQCVDGRMFDASRIGDDEPFTFKACEIQVC